MLSFLMSPFFKSLLSMLPHLMLPATLTTQATTRPARKTGNQNTRQVATKQSAEKKVFIC